jgi:hypothetical protein
VLRPQSRDQTGQEFSANPRLDRTGSDSYAKHGSSDFLGGFWCRGDERIAALDARCESVKNKIAGFASPWFVEFAGMPRAGKSGCISIVTHYLRRQKFSVFAPSEGASRLPDFVRNTNDLIA